MFVAERFEDTGCWADSLRLTQIIRPRHPDVVNHMVLLLSHRLAAECRNRLVAVGIDAPEWGHVDRGQLPGFHPDDEFPTFSRIGWQSFASA